MPKVRKEVAAHQRSPEADVSRMRAVSSRHNTNMVTLITTAIPRSRDCSNAASSLVPVVLPRPAKRNRAGSATDSGATTGPPVAPRTPASVWKALRLAQRTER